MTSSVPALNYNALGEPVADDQDAYVRALLSGAATLPGGPLDAAGSTQPFDPGVLLSTGKFAGIDAANLSADTLKLLQAHGMQPTAPGAWTYSSAANAVADPAVVAGDAASAVQVADEPAKPETLVLREGDESPIGKTGVVQHPDGTTTAVIVAPHGPIARLLELGGEIKHEAAVTAHRVLVEIDQLVEELKKHL